MIKNLRIYSIALTLAAGSFVHCNPAQAEIVQYDNQPISKVDIQVFGPKSLASYHKKNVVARIKTKANHFFSQADFDLDLKTLAREYGRVEPHIESVNGQMNITIKVWPKPTIRNLNWQGNTHVDASTLNKELGITQTSVFDTHSFNKAFHKVKAYYVKNGYFEAQLSYEVTPIEDSNEVDVSICINEGRAGRIEKIVFECFTKQEERDLLELMITKKYHFFFSMLTDEGTYNEEMIQQDQFIVLNYLQNNGYADAEVNLDVIESTTPNRIIIKISACKGECYRFGSITVEGNTVFPKEKIAQQMRIKKGKPYSPERIRSTLQNITNLYGRCGYIEANVNFEPKLECNDRTYSVHFTIEEGEKYCVGLIKVIGNCSTQTRVILHETLLTPGEVFNLDKLTLTERRLQNIGYFENVNVYAVRSEHDHSCLGGNYRDVHIEVEETGTGNFSAFAGFSTAENIFAGFNITEKNFNIAGLGCALTKGARALRGGGEYAHFTATFGASSRKYIFSWTKPYFKDTPWTIGFDIDRSSNRYISDDYEINASGLNLHGVYDLNAFVNLGIHYRFRYADIDVDHNASFELREQARRDKGIISAIGCTFMYDSTDSIMRPSNGFRSRLENEIAGVGGDFAFVGLAYLNTLYYPVGDRGVLKFRADARFIQPLAHTSFNDLPLDERLFLGGESEIRGYRPYRLGPKFQEVKLNPDGSVKIDPKTGKPKTKDSDDPKGGISMQMLSAEYQLKLWPIVDAFTFVDAGFLDETRWSFGNFNVSVGAGLRLQIMGNGPPLTIGMGYPIREKKDTNIKRFFFNVGGRF
ncbi:MAG: outer membrane protein assembly factor BamA [Chlamydiota bacterium]|nr:outer membrane protein assembly factor BamA [Chlamydiota bacterium]